MPNFYNDDQLTKGIVGLMQGVIDEVSEELKKLLDDDGGLIDTIIYQANTPKWYGRQGKSGGLMGMWDKQPTKTKGNSVQSEIYADDGLLVNDPDAFIHGSNYWAGGNDITGMLIDLVVGGGSGPLFGDGFWTGPRDFWTPFLEMLDDGTVSGLVEAAFRARGINFIKG